MAEWMNDIDKQLQQQADEAKGAQSIKEAAPRFYSALEKVVKEQTAQANQKFFDGRDVLKFCYEANTITGDHFLVWKQAFPALLAKLHHKSPGVFQSTISEKPSPKHDSYREVERTEIKVSTDYQGEPRLVRETTLLNVSDAAGLMLSPLVARALGLKKADT